MEEVEAVDTGEMEAGDTGETTVSITDTSLTLTSGTGSAGLLTWSSVWETSWDGTDGIPTGALSSSLTICW